MSRLFYNTNTVVTTAVLILIAFLFTTVFSAHTHAEDKTQHIVSNTDANMPKDLLPALAHSMGQSDVSYHINNDNGKYSAETTEHELTTYFGKDSIKFKKDSYEIDMKLGGIGRNDFISSIHSTSDIEIDENRIELERGNITEWYVNSPYGMEQGFTLSERPEGEGDIKLLLDLGLSEGLTAIDSNRNTIRFKNDEGQSVLTYGKLYVFDSNGVELASSMSLKGESIEIKVDDTGAQYPIVIDPFMFVQRVTQGDINDGNGFSVAIDGDRAIVGAPFKVESGNDGFAYIYERTGTLPNPWVLVATFDGNAAPLSVNRGGGSAEFGYSVDIEGNIAVVGARRDDVGSGNDHGTAWVFERNGGGTWTFVQELRAQSIGTDDFFGTSVGVSGTTIIVGSPGGDDSSNDNEGEAFVFDRTGAGANPWTLTLRINPDGGQGPDNGASFGTCVAISGTTAIIGAPDEDLGSGNEHGAAWIYNAPWTGNGQRINANPFLGEADFGTSCDIAGDRIIVGAPGEDVNGFSSGNDHGAAYIYEMSGTWPTTQTARIIASNTPSNAEDNFGIDVAILGDTAVVGSHDDDRGTGTEHGSVYIFEKSGTWPSTESDQIDAADASDLGSGDAFGTSVGITTDRIIVGSPFNDIGGQSNQGAAYFFEDTPTQICGNDIIEGTEQCDGGACCTDTCTFESGGTQCRASAGVCDVAEQCTGASAECPADGFDNVSQCRGSAGSCDVAEFCDGTGPSCPADAVVNSGVECRATAGVCDAAEFCDGVNATCPADGFTTGGVCRSSAGSCDVEEICNGSGPNCPADGFASGGTECRASAGICDVAEQCTGSSASCPADGFAPSNQTCRASADVCDVAEQCTGSSASCPADGFAPSNQTCRVSADVCDVAEQCTGSSAACPADGFAPSNQTCRASADVCDVAEQCTGSSAACPADGFAPSNQTCRAAAGVCDVEEMCTGSSASCPSDTKQASNFECRASGGICDVAETCDGTNNECPSDVKQATNFECRGSGGICDVAETCDGTNNECPADAKQASNFECRGSGGICDIAETCDGTNNECPSDAKQASNFQCRASGGICDVEEFCDGSTNECPANTFVDQGTVCRAEVPGGCDIEEVCDGSSALCPADVVEQGQTVCRAVADQICDIEEVCDGQSNTCPEDVVAEADTVCRAAADQICDIEEVCDGQSNVCPDDVVAEADTVCRAAVDQICDIEEVCDGQSNVCPDDIVADQGTVCRAVNGVCDVVETCTGATNTCPVDVFSSGNVCRPVAGVCDVQELCNGAMADCPADGFAPDSQECRGVADVCDVAEFCTGSGAACPADGFEPSTTECRASAGICDVAESCTGTGAACPADGFEPSTTECRASGGQCDIAENCTGAGVECPSDEKDSTTVCRASAGICDPEEICDGTNNDCPSDTLEASGTECRASAGFCDLVEECTGDSAACPSDEFEPDTLECRASEGICDIAEFCTGSGALCPGDSFEPVTTSCRASINSCDIEEFCDGSTAECPSDAFEELGTVCSADNGGPDGQCLRDPIVCVNQGLITIIKEADTPDEEDGEDFEFSCTDSTTAACADMGDENGMFFLDDPVIDDLDMVTDTETSDPMFIGEYTIEEMVPTGWQLDMIECVDDEDGETIADADAQSVLINLDPDEEVMCTFYNSDLPIDLVGFNNGTRLQVIKNRDNKVRINGITPDGLVRLFWGFRKGTDFVNGGDCAGTEINIRNMTKLADIRANENGNLNKIVFIPSTAQTKAFMVPLDLSNCMAGSRKQVTLLND